MHFNSVECCRELLAFISWNRLDLPDQMHLSPEAIIAIVALFIMCLPFVAGFLRRLRRMEGNNINMHSMSSDHYNVPIYYLVHFMLQFYKLTIRPQTTANTL